MGWAERLPSGKWRAAYRDPDGRKRSAGTHAHKAAATRAANAAEAAARAAGWRSPDAGRQTWGAWCAAWWPTRQVEASTLHVDAGRRNRWLLPRWGAVELADITRHDVRAWAAELRGKGLSPSTVQRVVHLLSASLTAAVDAEVLAANPAARLRLPPGEQAGERFLTREEYAAVRYHLEDDQALVADVLTHTGLRWGEAAGLHAHRLDLEQGHVYVVEAWSPRAKAVKPYPKGRKVRDVPLPGWLVEQLREALAGRPAATSCGLTHTLGRCRSPLVLTAPEGGVLDSSNYRRAWERACQLAGVGHVRLHDLRHTYASWLLQDGVTLAEVGALLGHVDPTTTQRYAHLGRRPTTQVLGALRDPRGAGRGAGEDSGTLRLTTPGGSGPAV